MWVVGPWTCDLDDQQPSFDFFYKIIELNECYIIIIIIIIIINIRCIRCYLCVTLTLSPYLLTLLHTHDCVVVTQFRYKSFS